MTPVVILGADCHVVDDQGPDLITRSVGSWRLSHWSIEQRELDILRAGGVCELWVDCGRSHPTVRLIAVPLADAHADDAPVPG
jgi:hypothetical protein